MITGLQRVRQARPELEVRTGELAQAEGVLAWSLLAAPVLMPDCQPIVDSSPPPEVYLLIKKLNELSF